MRIFTNIFILVAVFGSNLVFAQEKLNALQLLSDIKTLSSDAFQGRRTGSSRIDLRTRPAVQAVLRLRLWGPEQRGWRRS